MLTLLLAVCLEKTTCKNSSNSSIPPSQMDADETVRRSKPRRKARPGPDRSGPDLRKLTIEETIPVESCDHCGVDLSGVDPIDRERLVQYDIVFQVIERRVEAEVKPCPDCQTRSKAAFPASLSGPVQYGPGLQAFIINLLVAYMRSLPCVVELVRALSGLRLSEATCLGYIRRLHQALHAWQTAASRRHSDCARRLRCRHARTTLWPDTNRRLATNRGVGSYCHCSLRAAPSPGCNSSVLGVPGRVQRCARAPVDCQYQSVVAYGWVPCSQYPVRTRNDRQRREYTTNHFPLSNR